MGHVACLMLARVDGKSPAEYLTADERAQVRKFGDLLLSSPPGKLDEMAGIRRWACQ